MALVGCIAATLTIRVGLASIAALHDRGHSRGTILRGQNLLKVVVVRLFLLLLLGGIEGVCHLFGFVFDFHVSQSFHLIFQIFYALFLGYLRFYIELVLQVLVPLALKLVQLGRVEEVASTAEHLIVAVGRQLE